MAEGRQSRFARLNAWLRRASPVLVLVVGVGAGVIFWGGFNTAMEVSNEMAFCIGCHEMRETVYEEYKESLHYRNTSGVQATCADCHVPREWVHKVVRKVKATNELYHKALGTIDTPEKFEAKRWVMANRVWDNMRATDSRECRNCHDLAAMDLDEQDRSARKKHAKAEEQGKTCIDCHKGIAHDYPRRPKTDEAVAAR
jgi:cytochrome c-type protein NapC